MWLNAIISFFCWALLVGIPQLVLGQSYEEIAKDVTWNCSEPLTWKIGSIDPRYAIDEQIIKQSMSDISNLWSEAAGKKLIAYSDSGEVAINLIYSDYQKSTDDEKKLAERIKKMRIHYFSLNQNYQRLSLTHQVKLKEYHTIQDNYREEVNEYKSLLTKWASTGALSKEKDERIKNLKEKVAFLESKYEKKLKEVNTLSTKMMELSVQVNEYADEANKLIFYYQKKFSVRQTFKQGVYTNLGGKKKINIYQFDNINKLRLVLAHEVGHALGLKHVTNPQSIMYYLMGRQNEQVLQLEAEDIKAIRQRCSSE